MPNAPGRRSCFTLASLVRRGAAKSYLLPWQWARHWLFGTQYCLTTDHDGEKRVKPVRFWPDGSATTKKIYGSVGILPGGGIVAKTYVVRWHPLTWDGSFPAARFPVEETGARRSRLETKEAASKGREP